MRPNILAKIAAVLVLSTLGTAGSQMAIAASNAAVQDLPPPDPVSYDTQAPTDYRVGPFDMLDVSVLQVDNLNRTVQVSPTGVISLPLSGDFNVTGKTTKQIEADIEARLSRHDLQDPEVTVTVKDSASLKFTVEGSVAQPGVYPIGGSTTLLQALATAKGTDQFADDKRVMIYRQVGGQRREAIYDVGDIRRGKTPDPQIYPGDLVVVAVSKSKRGVRDWSPLIPLVALAYLLPK